MATDTQTQQQEKELISKMAPRVANEHAHTSEQVIAYASRLRAARNMEEFRAIAQHIANESQNQAQRIQEIQEQQQHPVVSELDKLSPQETSAAAGIPSALAYLGLKRLLGRNRTSLDDEEENIMREWDTARQQAEDTWNQANKGNYREGLFGRINKAKMRAAFEQAHPHFSPLARVEMEFGPLDPSQQEKFRIGANGEYDVDSQGHFIENPDYKTNAPGEAKARRAAKKIELEELAATGGQGNAIQRFRTKRSAQKTLRNIAREEKREQRIYPKLLARFDPRLRSLTKRAQQHAQALTKATYNPNAGVSKKEFFAQKLQEATHANVEQFKRRYPQKTNTPQYQALLQKHSSSTPLPLPKPLATVQNKASGLLKRISFPSFRKPQTSPRPIPLPLPKPFTKLTQKPGALNPFLHPTISKIPKTFKTVFSPIRMRIGSMPISINPRIPAVHPVNALNNAVNNFRRARKIAKGLKSSSNALKAVRFILWLRKFWLPISIISYILGFFGITLGSEASSSP
jgi:hypothetical protein